MDESGYAVTMMLAGGEEEEILFEKSTERHKMSIWAKKTAVGFAPFPDVNKRK